MARSLDKTPNYRFDASCSQNLESGELPVANHDRSPSFESTRHQNDSRESCPVIEPSAEQLKTNGNPGFFFFSFFFDLHT